MQNSFLRLVLKHQRNNQELVIDVQEEAIQKLTPEQFLLSITEEVVNWFKEVKNVRPERTQDV